MSEPLVTPTALQIRILSWLLPPRKLELWKKGFAVTHTIELFGVVQFTVRADPRDL